MPSNNGAFFDGNGEPLPKRCVRWKHLARQTSAWGIMTAAPDIDDQVKEALNHDAFTRIDRGNLQRIADGVENLVTLLRIALEPQLGEAVRQRDAWYKEQRRQAQALLMKHERTHGPCPPKVARAMMKELLSTARFYRQNRMFIHADPDRDEAGFAADNFAYFTDTVPQRLPAVGKKGSKLRKAYETWRRKRIKKAD